MFERGQRVKYMFYPNGGDPEEILCIVMDTRMKDDVQFVDLFDYEGFGMRDNVRADQCELDCFQEMVEVNASRYPKHMNAAKGQVFGGICNRTACSEVIATWWNLGTYSLYCRQCAMGINENSYRTRKPPICIEVESKPPVREHDELKKKHNYYGAY